MILSFAKPKKVMSSEDYASISADSAPPGVYSGNMSTEDRHKWKAKLVGQKSKNYRIEIRSEAPLANVVIVVCGAVPNPKKDKWGRLEWEPHVVKISSNGAMLFRQTACSDVLSDMIMAINEARRILRFLDDEPEKRKEIEKACREGRHPLEDACDTE